jgi:multiple sugar transport system permease protein
MRHESSLFRLVRAVVLVALACFVLFPVYVGVSSAMTPLGDLLGPTFHWVPVHATLRSFVTVWPDLSLGLGFKNSLIVMLCTTAIATPVAVGAAFAIGRFTFIGRRTLLLTMMSTQVFPGLLFLIPLYLIFLKIQALLGIALVGSYTGLVITYLSFTLPLSVWILTGVISRFPRDLEEAGIVDGLTEIGAFVRVVLPNIRGAIVAVAMFACITSWSEVLFASVLTNGSTQTLPILLSSIVAAPGEAIRWNDLMAAAIYASAPVALSFYLVQKQFVAGIAGGAVKG